MGRDFSFSVFTVEINGTPTVALQAKRHHEAERFCEQDRLRADLSTFKSNGVPLCNAKADKTKASAGTASSSGFHALYQALRISVRYRAPVSTLRQHQGRRFALPVIRTRERALTIGPLRLPSVRLR